MSRLLTLGGGGLLVLVAGLGACNPTSCLPTLSLPDIGFGSLHRPEDPITDALVVQGRVLQRSSEGQVSSLSGATVRVTAGNGESTEVTSDSDGKYRAELTVAAPRKVLVTYTSEGLSPVHRTYFAGPRSNIRENVTLVELKALSCTGATCATDDGRVSIRNLANGITGSARVFNPTTETTNFPGAFDDSSGNLLISGVFSLVQLSDESGNPVDTLGSPAELRMEMPKQTWKVVVDLHPSTDRIEVPLYAFDEAQGTWVREGEGFLEDGMGTVLPESALPAIRNGSFEGALIACGNVTHFSSWNVDWPVSTKACLTGIVLDREGHPAEGAIVIARGLTYDGFSAGTRAGADGKFCVEMMRSDGPGEDIDQDGITGETQRVKLRVSYRGVLYEVGQFDTPATNGTCPDGPCTDVGTLQISTENELIPVICSLSGRVKDKRGNGVANATVVAFDPGVESEQLITLCTQGACGFLATSSEDGSYTITTGIAEGLSLLAFESHDVNGSQHRNRFGSANPQGCPSTPVDIVLSEGRDLVDVTVSVSGQTIAWTPDLKASALSVSRDGDALWRIAGEFSSPVTYGTVPAGAMRVDGADGGVPALSSGDVVDVILSGEDSDGNEYFGSGSVTVP